MAAMAAEMMAAIAVKESKAVAHKLKAAWNAHHRS